MKIGILAAGTTPDELTDRYDTYAQMFVDLLGKAGADFEYAVYDVRDDVFPQSAGECDGWIISGSKFNVYQKLPWMLKLEALITEIDRLGNPIVGICFGHQIVAEAMGGKVDKYEGGWGVGLHTYRLTDAADITDMPEFTINAMHQDQVIVKPENARVFAESDFCRYAGLLYGDHIMTFQAHPEFTIPYEQDLVAARKGSVVPDDVADEGLKTVCAAGAETDSVEVGKWMAAFLTRGSKGQ
ncbi:MAG: glutamine amidotransferase [Oceanospirillaceae bacterium]|nr:glutamine amidotransferase [Oceanospirillaceae bacterium]MBT10674.1 glutamine amidotransferase [Oceanospirillaceae bacterium]|tara:strand:+ start:7821 stop:8543 length:723 start_codon:yes stop_codon:yes gene_type:complete